MQSTGMFLDDFPVLRYQWKIFLKLLKYEKKFAIMFCFQGLIMDMRLYKSLCWLVNMSVHLLVGPSLIENTSQIGAIAILQALGIVYSVLLRPLPNSTCSLVDVRNPYRERKILKLGVILYTISLD